MSHDGSNDVVVHLDGDLFDLSRPSPLPAPMVIRDAIEHPALAAALRVVAADRGTNVEDRIRARLALADAWLTAHAIGPCLDALRSAEKLQPDHLDVLDRLARVLPRVSLLREAAAARRTIAQRKTGPATLFASACAWLRTDDHVEALHALDELTRVAPDDPRTAALLVTFARLRANASGNALLVSTLLECGEHARRREDRERWREHCLDAWIESRGVEGGEALTEALAATGRPRAAVYVAAETAARALQGATPDKSLAARLLVRCARVAETAGLPSEAVSAWMARALIADDGTHDARESLRDVLAEQGRSLELAARLRADACRAHTAARTAAWKGVAAIEIASHPAHAAQALVECLRFAPDDGEALELLSSLFDDVTVAATVRDAMWTLANGTVEECVARSRLLRDLARHEELAGDLASAEAALAAIESPHPEIYEAIAKVHNDANAIATRAEEALAALERCPGDAQEAALDALLDTFGETPGAFRDVRSLTRVLAPRALRNDRAAVLWVRALRRIDRGAHLGAALRRLATRAESAATRTWATLECAAVLDREGDARGAAEMLTLLLDEVPTEPQLAVALAAIAEHVGDATLSADAMNAMAHAATDPMERAFLARFTGRTEGIFAVFASSLGDPTPTQQRCDDLARLHDLVGDSTTLLALRTRALMALNGPIREALSVARRFAMFAPLSPEAALAWFGAANVAGDAAQIASSASAVITSLSTVRDVSATVRTAFARLDALSAPDAARALALETAATVGIADRLLRASMVELIRRAPGAPETLPLIEHMAAASSADDERMRALRSLVDGYRRTDNPALELAALTRLKPDRHDAAWSRLLELVARSGDRARYARMLTERVEDMKDITERRALFLTIATEYAAAIPPHDDAALECIDRIAQDAQGPEVQAIIVRALLALGQPDAVVGRLMRWAAECLSDVDAATRLRCAAHICRDVLRSPSRALATLRTLLRRTPLDDQALEMAEEVAVESGNLDTLMPIYTDLNANAAGQHARHALAYRRACILERAGRPHDALDEQLAIFARGPALGASFTAIERLAARTGRYDVQVRALGLLGAQSMTPEIRARYFLKGAELARTAAHDPRLSLLMEFAAFQSAHDPTVEASLRRHARLALTSFPAEATTTFTFLVDDALSAAHQAWDDDVRHTHALHALELCLDHGVDAARASEALEMFLDNQEDIAHAQRTVSELVEIYTTHARVREIVRSHPAMRIAAPSPSTDAAAPSALRQPTPPPLPSSSSTPLRHPTPLPLPPAEAQTRVSPLPPEPEVSERPSQLPARGGRLPSRPPKQPFNPRAAIEAGYPVRTATPVFTATGSTPPPRRSSSPPSQPPTPVASASQPPAFPPPAASATVTASIVPTVAATPPAVAITTVSTIPSARRSAVPATTADGAQHRVRMTVSSLREAAERGDDQAAAALARHLAQNEETRDEAMMLQRRRFDTDPSRLDALESLVEMYAALRMRNESMALASVHAVLTNRSLDPWPDAPTLTELADSPEGVARVLTPQSLGPYPELGALMWEALNNPRREPRHGFAQDRTFVSPANDFGRCFSAAVRLLQLPKTTPVIVRGEVTDGIAMTPSTSPPTVMVASALAVDNAHTRLRLGETLEATRSAHLVITAHEYGEGEHTVAAMLAAFGRSPPGRLDPAVGRIASRLYEGTPTRSLRHVQDLVEQLGTRLNYSTWRSVVDQARIHAGMLVCGDFRVASAALLETAPGEVPRDASRALAIYEPLRALARFAVSEEYLLLRWQRTRPDRW